MKIFVKSWFWQSSMVAISVILAQAVSAQSPSPVHTPSMIGQVPVAKVLQQLGAMLERGATTEALDGYSSQFDRTDPDRDGKHTKAEYVDNGAYMTLQARIGIFRAADGNADGLVTKAEYVLNRIITDEAKAIIQDMDDDKDGLVERGEFIQHAARLLTDLDLAEQVFVALDMNRDGGLPIPEYLRVWGQWARAGHKPAEVRIATRRAELAVAKAPDRRVFSEGRPDGFSPPRGQGSMRPGQAGPGRLASSGLQMGKPFPLINIFDAQGNPFSTEQLKGHTTVLVAGCLTCPAFLSTYPGVEAVYRDYASRGVQFFYVYRALAHPENNGMVTPFILRATNSVGPCLAARFVRQAGVTILLDADPMDHPAVGQDLGHRHLEGQVAEASRVDRPAVSLLNVCSGSIETTTARLPRRNYRSSLQSDFLVTQIRIRTALLTRKRSRDSGRKTEVTCGLFGCPHAKW